MSLPDPKESQMKLYVVTREDLDPGAVAAQSVHGAIKFCREHRTIADFWYMKSNNIVLLSVPNEAALKHLASRAGDEGLAVSLFREPDFDDTVTSIAIEPDGWRLVSSLPLALKPRKEAA